MEGLYTCVIKCVILAWNMPGYWKMTFSASFVMSGGIWIAFNSEKCAVTYTWNGHRNKCGCSYQVSYFCWF